MPDASHNTIAQNIKIIQTRITAAEKKYHREPGSVQLLAVSKTRPVDDIRAAMAASQYHFGENYLQDALAKIQAPALAADREKMHWHFIGPIQSNKTQAIARYFSWVHSIDRLKIARRLSEQREGHQNPLNICIQVNISQENSKSGVSPEEAILLAGQVNCLPNLHLRGLMAIPVSNPDFEQQRHAFRLLRELKEEIQSHGINLDTLSMGMTNDMESAIAEGATIVRIGTAIFGERN